MITMCIEDSSTGFKLEMAYIPRGRFVMGSPDKEEGRDPDEGPQHTVTIKHFLMSIYPITQEQYRAIIKGNPSQFKGQKRPVEMVSWKDAKSFCQKLSKKTGVKFSLPSESQWEYACRAGTTTPFNFGDTITSEVVNHNGSYHYGNGPKNGEYRGQTTDVGSFPPNSFGLYDMHGNVWEWCADDWHDDYNGAPLDGRVWLDGDKQFAPLRGGSWVYSPKYCRSAFRCFSLRRDDFNDEVGFRVVCGGGRAL